MEAQVQSQFEKYQIFGKQICQEMLAAIFKLGFSNDDISGHLAFDSAEFSLTKDPYTAEENLTGSWYDAHQQRIGQIQFNSDASFYAEYDIVKPHPTKKQWFVEAMSAWGNADGIKTEAKLLAALE